MTEWLWVGGYATGFIFTYRRIYAAFDNDDFLRGSNDGFDRASNAIIAIIASTMWPIVLIGYYIWKFATPVTPRQKEEELQEREARIKELERELGIGD